MASRRTRRGNWTTADVRETASAWSPRPPSSTIPTPPTGSGTMRTSRLPSKWHTARHHGGRWALTPAALRPRSFLLRGPTTPKPQLHNGKHKQDREHHPRQRRGVTELQEGKSMLEQHDAQNIRRRLGSPVTSGQNVDEIECLECMDDRDDDHERHGAANQRHGDRHELTQLPRTIESGRFIEVLRHALHGSQQDDRRERHAAPYADDAQGGHGVFRIDEPGNRVDTDPAEDDVEQAVVGVEHKLPDDGHHHRRHGQRQEDNCPKNGYSLYFPVEHTGHGEADEHRGHDSTHGVNHRVAQRDIEQRVFGKEAAVVRQADELGRAEHIPIVKAHVQRESERKQHEHRDRRQIGRDEDATSPGAPPRRPAPAGYRRGGCLGWGHDVRSTSSILGVSPSVSDAAGREPRRTGPMLRSINATIFGHAGVTGRPSACAGPPVSTAILPILLCALAKSDDRTADRSAGTNRPVSAITACPTGPAANFTNSHACFLRGLLDAMASPVVPIFDWAACPFGPVGSTVMSKSRSGARSSV